MGERAGQVPTEIGTGQGPRVALAIPCYRASASVVDVVRRIGSEVDRIYLVDDACPDRSGVKAEGSDPRLVVLRNERNLGVGGAVKRAYHAALADGVDIIVKIDADGQMDPAFIPRLLAPILAERADYAKGNRLALAHRMPGRVAETRMPMPVVRRFGNNVLSFLHKAVTGYWNIVDPTNGFTAIHARVLESIDLDAVADCYFFETDMLFQLNLVDAVVRDVPLPAHYSGEVSSLSVTKVAIRFPAFAFARLSRRVAVKYFVQDFNVASLELLLGLPLLLFGTMFGIYRWIEASGSGVANTPGTVMLAALPIIIGFQLLLSALSYDVFNTPKHPISDRQGE